MGKDTVLRRLRELGRPYHFAVTATTRPPRVGERHAVDYYFLSGVDYDRTLAEGGFLEHATVYGRRYGVPLVPLREALAARRDVLVRTDVQGAATIRHKVPQAVLIFLLPSSLEELEERLGSRRSETVSDVQTRLDLVRQELAELPRFDYAVVNADGRLEECVAVVEAIIAAEKRRVGRGAPQL